MKSKIIKELLDILFVKNDVHDAVLIRNYQTFMLTLDTPDYVPEKYNEKILSHLYKKILKKQFKYIGKVSKKIEVPALKDFFNKLNINDILVELKGIKPRRTVDLRVEPTNQNPEQPQPTVAATTPETQ